MYGLTPYEKQGSLAPFGRDFDEFIGQFLGDTWVAWRNEFSPKWDIKETDQGLELDVELPGLKPDEVEVSLEGGLLTIRGEKKSEREEDKDGYHLRERSFGRFHRGLRVPFAVNEEKLEATHKDGVLHLVVPKAEKAKPSRIEVKAG